MINLDRAYVHRWDEFEFVPGAIDAMREAVEEGDGDPRRNDLRQVAAEAHAPVRYSSSLTPYQSDLADTIRDSAFALLGILDDILDFSKIEAGKLEIEAASFSIHDVVNDVLRQLSDRKSVV